MGEELTYTKLEMTLSSLGGAGDRSRWTFNVWLVKRYALTFNGPLDARMFEFLGGSARYPQALFCVAPWFPEEVGVFAKS